MMPTNEDNTSLKDVRSSDDISPDLAQVHNVIQKWLLISDRDMEIIDCYLAILQDRHIGGDPIWAYLIAVSGDVKTELLRTGKSLEWTYTLDDLTPRTLISGKVYKDKETGEAVPRLQNHSLYERRESFRDFRATEVGTRWLLGESIRHNA